MNKEKVLDYITAFKVQFPDQSPTYRQIALSLGCPEDRVKNTGIPLAQYYVNLLEKDGSIIIGRGKRIELC